MTTFKMIEVDNSLKNLGIQRTSKVSLCLKAAIFNGFIKLTGKVSDLKTIVFESKSPEFCPCGKTFIARLENLLYQPDFGGYDQEELNFATVRCDCASGCIDPDCNINSLYRTPHAVYVTDICKGRPSITSGQFQNHCDECPNFGMCIGDYRDAHCLGCHEHFFKNRGECSCPNCH